MTAKQIELIDGWVGDCETHEDWLAIVGFCLPTLLLDQVVLWKLITNEAKKMSGANEFSAITIQQILRELLLHLEVVL